METVECPSCLTDSEDVLTAFSSDNPCPVCGLGAAAAKRVIQVRRGYATDAVKDKFAQLTIDLDKAQNINRRLHNFLSRLISASQAAITYDGSQGEETTV